MAIAKLMFAARAKPGLTRAQALQHLRERHGPLVAASTTNRQRLKTYIQNHAIEIEGVPALTAEHDWIIESWRDMSVTLPEPPVAPDAITLREDEARFPDRATLLTLQVVEEPVWQAEPGTSFATAPIKVFSYMRYPGLADAPEFDLRWANRAEKLATHPAFRKHVASFVRNRPVPGAGAPVNVTAAPSAATSPPYDAVDIWRFRDADAVTALFADQDFGRALAEYERHLIDATSLFRLVTREIKVFDDALVDLAGC